MPNKPLVSIMIPTYNQSTFIANAIESALKQDYCNIEIIVSDDYSDDNTETIAQKYSKYSNFYYYKNISRLGRIGNYHKLLHKYANGEWVINLDGDDYFTDNSFISKSIDLIEKDKNTVFVQAGHYLKFSDKSESIIKIPHIKESVEKIEGKKYILNFKKINHFSHLATLYNRQKAIEAGFYVSDILSSDIESILKLATFGNVVLIKEAVGVWYQHDGNISSSSGINKLIENLQWIDNVSNYLIKKNGEKKLWETWKNKIYKEQLTGIYHHEAKLKKNISEKFQLLKYFWENYRFLFFYPIFIKKTIDSLLK